VSSSEKLQRLCARAERPGDQVVSCPDGETAIQKVTRRVEAASSISRCPDSRSGDSRIALAQGISGPWVVAFVDPEFR